MVTSPFPSRVRRPILPPIGLQSVFREVRTEDELRQALTPVDVNTVGALLANTGRRIVIAGPITLKSPVVIAASLPGVVIESHGHIPIYPGVHNIDAFVVQAPLTTIRGLLLIAAPDNSKAWNRAIVVEEGTLVIDDTVSPGNSRFLDIHLFGGNQLIDDTTAGTADDCYVERCFMQRFSDAVNYDGIFCDSTGWRIIGNHMTGQGTGVAIRVGANGGHCAVVGNDCNDDGITTSASSGLNTISANTRAGAVTAAGTDDALGGNT